MYKFSSNSFEFIIKNVFCFFSEKEQQEAIEHIDEVQNEIDRWVLTFF